MLYNNPSYSHILIGSPYDLLEDGRIDDDSTRFNFFFNFLNFEFEPITILC